MIVQPLTSTPSDRRAPVLAKRRKRCPSCRKMIEPGQLATLTDDRYLSPGAGQWGGRTYKRGAWHLWHPDCLERVRGEGK